MSRAGADRVSEEARRHVTAGEGEKAEGRGEEDVTGAGRVVGGVPSEPGLCVVRAFAPEPGLMPAAQSVLSKATCKPDPLPAER